MDRLFEIQYPAEKRTTGLNPKMLVFTPDHKIDDGQSCEMKEIESTGVYFGYVKVDSPNWSVQCMDELGGTANYLIGVDQYAVIVVLDTVVSIQLAVNNIDVKIDSLAAAIGEVSTATDVILLKSEQLSLALTDVLAKIDELILALGAAGIDVSEPGVVG